jgi:hypothetical protein
MSGLKLLSLLSRRQGVEPENSKTLQAQHRPIAFFSHHKCGTDWLSRYLNEFCRLNRLSLFCTHRSYENAPQSAQVTSLVNAEYNYASANYEGGIHIIRNPLDVVVSAYYSHLRTHPLDGWPSLEAQRRVIANTDAHSGFILTTAFLERDDFYDGAVGPLHALRHWDFNDDRFKTIRLEDLVTSPRHYLTETLSGQFHSSQLPKDEEFSFESIAGRPIGTVDDTSHYRSGQAEQWRTELPDALVDYIRAHYAPILEQFYPASLCN